jgi:hypothetical protein
MSRLASTKSMVRSLVTSDPDPPDPHSRDDHDDNPCGNISPQERIKRVAANLGRSFTSRPRSPTLTLHPESKRTLSLKRKDRGKEARASQDQGQGDFCQEKCSQISVLLNPLKVIITLPCHRSLMDHKAWIMYPHRILRLSRMMIHPSLRLHRQRLHPHGRCSNLFEISVRCVCHFFLFTTFA